MHILNSLTPHADDGVSCALLIFFHTFFGGQTDNWCKHKFHTHNNWTLEINSKSYTRREIIVIVMWVRVRRTPGDQKNYKIWIYIFANLHSIEISNVFFLYYYSTIIWTNHSNIFNNFVFVCVMTWNARGLRKIFLFLSFARAVRVTVRRSTLLWWCH